MLTRNCLKFAIPTKIYVSRRITIADKYLKPIVCVQCNQNFKRVITTTAFPSISSGKPEMKYSPATLRGPRRSNPEVSAITSEELLEKLIADLSSDIHQKNRVYMNVFMKVLQKVKELNFSTRKQSLLLIRCCGELLPDEPPASRMNLVEDVWNTLKSHTKFDVGHYNELLNVYIANNRTLTVTSFMEKLGSVTPNIKTYELLLRALGEAGDLNQSMEVIANMKALGIPANENIFNSLIICQGKLGNLKNIEEVLTMMKSLKLEPSIDTYTALVRTHIWNKKHDAVVPEMEKALLNNLKFQEKHIMEIVKTAAAVGNYAVLPEILKFLPEETLKLPSISPYMQSVSTQLVFQNHPVAALEIYKCLSLPSFGPKDDQGLHGRSLVRDCVKASMPSNVIVFITQELMSSGRNPIALQNACEAALQLGKVPLALDLFLRMKQLGMPLRPHYYWPILLHSSKTNGEKGIMNTLQNMVSTDVIPDYETVLQYVIPHVSFTSPQNLMKKFLDTGLSVSNVLTPMMETLLNTGQVRAASELCELFQGKIEGDKILKPLIKGYLTSMDALSTSYILEDLAKNASQKDKDWVGRFLCEFIQHNKTKEDVSDFINILKEIKNRSLKISTTAADFCVTQIPQKCTEEKMDTIRSMLIELTDEKLFDEGEIQATQMPHPKSMNEEDLQAHLKELEAKGMNTRGVLRRLLQMYCRQGNLAAAREIVDKCQKEGVFLSAGMKASIFDLHVKLGELELAELSLSELNKSSPNFTLDEFKVIDFATLMVYRKKFDKAKELIVEQSKKRRVAGGRQIELNCWRLLDATAANGNPKQTHAMFDLLMSYGYCRPTNVILGPLIRVHLNNENLEEAVNEYTRLANKYSKTPLKHELMCKILLEMSDGQTEDNFLSNEKANGRLNKMAQAILNADRKVHGPGDVQLTLMAALADVGYKKTLRKMILDPSLKFHPQALMRRCERFAEEKKLAALETVAECCKGIRNVDIDEIYCMMLNVHKRDDNYKGALELWTRMQDSDITPSTKFIRDLISLLKANKRDIPSELILIAGKSMKSLQTS